MPRAMGIGQTARVTEGDADDCDATVGYLVKIHHSRTRMTKVHMIGDTHTYNYNS
jgi:hypothetical protein